jgi:hypothetical protein
MLTPYRPAGAQVHVRAGRCTLERLDSTCAKAFRFGAGKEVQTLLFSRNRFVHEGEKVVQEGSAEQDRAVQSTARRGAFRYDPNSDKLTLEKSQALRR